MSTSDSKTCTKCGQVKPLDEYYFEKDRPRASCKDCHRKRITDRINADRAGHNIKRHAWAAKNRDKLATEQRDYVARNREEVNARRRGNWAADPERFRSQQRAWWDANRNKIGKQRRAWYAANRDEIRTRRRENRDREREHDRAYRERNREKVNERGRRYYARHPEKWENARRAREARKAGVEHRPYTRREIYERDEGRCRECQKELPLKPRGFQIDHIVPISLGGPDIPANVQLMCPTCNRRKWASLEGQIHFAC